MIYLALRIGLFLSLFLLLFASDEYHSRQRSTYAYVTFNVPVVNQYHLTGVLGMTNTMLTPYCNCIKF